MKLLKSHVQALELIYFMNPCHVRMLQSLGGANIYKIQEKDKASAFYCDDLCKISVWYVNVYIILFEQLAS